MGRPRLRSRARRTYELTEGMEAWLRGEPIPDDGQPRKDWIGLEYFGSVEHDGRLIEATTLVEKHPEIAAKRHTHANQED